MRPLVLAVSLMLSAAAARGEDLRVLGPDPDDWSHRVAHVAELNRCQDDGDPLNTPIVACAGTACARHGPIALDADEAAAIRRLFVPAAADAQAERRAIGGAIALFETFVGSRNGTWAALPRNEHSADDDAGQMDCISEASNTRTYLDRLERAGLLSHHRPGDFVMRYLLLLQHVAVAITDRDDGEEYVVDSWVGANGDEPEIAPYSQWRAQWGV